MKHFCPMITIIDVEVSGLESESYPIQVAWNIDEEVHSYFINPETADGWNFWSKASEAVHGISRSYLIEHGLPVEVVAQHMRESLEGRDVYSDAVDMDLWWCQRLFEQTDVKFQINWKNYWYRMAKEKPPILGVPDSYGQGRWQKKIYAKAVSKLNLREHLADHDVRIRMEAFRIAVEENHKWDY